MIRNVMIRAAMLTALSLAFPAANSHALGQGKRRQGCRAGPGHAGAGGGDDAG